MTDNEVVQEILAGNTPLFSELVSRYENKLIRHIHRRVRSLEQARDLTQDTFLKVHARLSTFNPTHQFGPWIYRIATNLTIDWLRSRRQTAPIDTLDLPSPDPRPVLDNVEEVTHVLQNVPDPYRATLIMHDLQGLSHSEIAALERRTEATIRWRLSTARTMFRAAWEARLTTSCAEGEGL